MIHRWAVFVATVASSLAAAAVAVRAVPADARPLAAVAVAASAAVVLLAALSLRAPPLVVSAPPPVAVTSVRDWMTGGGFGREEIVRMLDRLDRMSEHPALAVRSDAEMDRIRRMPREAFLRAVMERLDEIEGPA